MFFQRILPVVSIMEYYYNPSISGVSRQMELASLVTEARAPLLRPSSSCVRSLLRRSGRVVGRFAPSPQSGASSLNRVSTPLPPAPRSGRGVQRRGSRPVPAVSCRSSYRPVADRWRSRAAEGEEIARPGAPHTAFTPPSPTRPHRGLARARLRDGTALVCANRSMSQLQPTATTRVSTWGEALAAPPVFDERVTPLRQSRDADPVRQRSPRAIFDAETPGQPAFPEQILTD